MQLQINFIMKQNISLEKWCGLTALDYEFRVGPSKLFL